MKIVVSGGRKNENSRHVFSVLDRLDPDIIYVGDCPTGVDKHVRQWCKDAGEEPKVFKADWNKLGLSAGPIRNRTMMYEALVKGGFILIAFQGGKGTYDCVTRATYNQIPVLYAE